MIYVFMLSAQGLKLNKTASKNAAIDWRDACTSKMQEYYLCMHSKHVRLHIFNMQLIAAMRHDPVRLLT